MAGIPFSTLTIAMFIILGLALASLIVADFAGALSMGRISLQLIVMLILIVMLALATITLFRKQGKQ